MPEIIVASTTDDQNSINLAAGVGVEEEKTETPEGEEPETQTASDAAKEEKHESKSAVQKRIDKLTREKHEARKEAEELKAKLLEAQRGGKPQPEIKEPPKETADPEPKEEDFTDYKDFVKATARWEIREEMRAKEAKEAEKSAKQKQDDAARTIVEAYNKRVEEAHERYDDFDDVLNRSFKIPDEVALAVIEMENGPDVAYYLGKHPEVCKKMMASSVLSAIAEAGKISAALMPVEESNEEEEKPVPKIPTRAKEPIRPVGGNSTKSSVPLDELPYRDYARIREKQEKDRFRR